MFAFQLRISDNILLEFANNPLTLYSIIAPFENIERVEQWEDKIYVTLTNELEIDAYILSEEEV